MRRNCIVRLEWSGTALSGDGMALKGLESERKAKEKQGVDRMLNVAVSSGRHYQEKHCGGKAENCVSSNRTAVESRRLARMERRRAAKERSSEV